MCEHDVKSIAQLPLFNHAEAVIRRSSLLPEDATAFVEEGAAFVEEGAALVEEGAALVEEGVAFVQEASRC